MRRAAVYVPGGRAPYPSTVVMGAITARAAGVREIVVCAPPGPGGGAHPVILAACVLCEVTEVYRMGGAQAIAALAYGTESVRPVDVIVGPGNPYVQEAKRQVVGQVGIDGIAGPSELVVIAAGAGADPELIALDLMAQAEHGPDSPVWCLSPDTALLDAVAALLEERRTDGEAQLVETSDAAGALALTEEIAPEHLELVGEEAEALADRVRNAGCLFVGAGAATAFGDYVAGSNHVLPDRRAPPGSSRRCRRPRSGGAWLAYPCRARPPLVSRPPARHLRERRAFLCTQSQWSAAREPHLADPSHHRRDRRPAVARPRRHGRG